MGMASFLGKSLYLFLSGLVFYPVVCVLALLMVLFEESEDVEKS